MYDAHSRCWDLLGVYVLGQLEDAEVTELELHLRECASCRQEAADLREVSDMLREAGSRAAQSGAIAPGVKERVLAALLCRCPSRKQQRQTCVRCDCDR